jgi:hypothetical protein
MMASPTATKTGGEENKKENPSSERYVSRKIGETERVCRAGRKKKGARDTENAETRLQQCAAPAVSGRRASGRC